MIHTLRWCQVSALALLLAALPAEAQTSTRKSSSKAKADAEEAGSTGKSSKKTSGEDEDASPAGAKKKSSPERDGAVPAKSAKRKSATADPDGDSSGSVKVRSGTGSSVSQKKSPTEESESASGKAAKRKGASNDPEGESSSTATKTRTGESSSTTRRRSSTTATDESSTAESTGNSKQQGGGKPKRVDANPEANAVAEKAMDPAAKPAADPAAKVYAPSATLKPEQLQGFDKQPEKIQKLIRDSLELAGRNLTYTFGSDDPANGGMDCSGSVSYLLKQQGFSDVPRTASGQYVWARKEGKFFAVVSKKSGGFEFENLQAGDLMFWAGTYNADRDPPVTHSMIYLGVEKGRKTPVMWGSSDGRPYNGQARNGVSVFDFKMPQANGSGDKPKADFLGYARIPGLREDAKPNAVAEKNPEAVASSEESKSEEKPATSKKKTASKRKASPAE